MSFAAKHSPSNIQRADVSAGDEAAAAPPGLTMVPAICCLCGVEDAEPIGVGEDFECRTSAESFLAVRCRLCGLVYLAPRPADSEAGRIYPSCYHAFNFDRAAFGIVHRVRAWLETRRLRSWCRGLPPDARILDIGCGDGFHLGLLKERGKPGWTVEGADTDARAVAAGRRAGLTVHHGKIEDLRLPLGAYDLILVIMTIEHLADPVGLLSAAGALLAPRGRVVIVTDNAASPNFWMFRGRHWGGYHFPRHFYLFTKPTLAKLAATAGLSVTAIATGVSPVNWTYSIRNWLDDWGAPSWLVNQFTLKSPFALAAFTLLDIPFAVCGRGSILRGIFVRPDTEAP